METVTVLRSCVAAAPFAFSRPAVSISTRPGSVRLCPNNLTKACFVLKKYPLRFSSKLNNHQTWWCVGRKKCGGIRASSSSDSLETSAPIAPLELESPIGQLLSKILVSHPHLFAAAVEQQLQQLQTDRDAPKRKDDNSTSGTDLILYRRIAEVKANERKKVLEEILYALVVQKFMDANVSLVPTIASSSESSGKVDTWPRQDDKLEQLHSPEAYEMIQNHLAFILGNRWGDASSIAQVSKLKVGQVYAASVMYGYFLKRVDQRFQLEKAMKILSQGNPNEESIIEHIEETRPNSGNVNNSLMNKQQPEVSSRSSGVDPGAFEQGFQTSRLKTYVMSFDTETLQRYATMRSKEAISIIEKHTEALFGRREIVITSDGTVDSTKEETMKISFGGVTQLVLEAVTFGSFLWDVESHVDSRYHFVTS